MIPVILHLPLSRAVFLDRDGVLTRERQDYVKTPEELEILPGVYGPLQEVRRQGFRIVVVTNQSVVGRGYTSLEGMERIHEKLRRELGKHGCYVDAIYFCPHLPEQGCECRKPAPGLILKAAEELGIDTQNSWMIGDKEIDLEAAKRAGCHGIRVPTNSGGLAEAVKKIFAAEQLNIPKGGS
jgi:D-glycero-D-manno-heptose 1,7-bisphosphate phosphatase